MLRVARLIKYYRSRDKKSTTSKQVVGVNLHHLFQDRKEYEMELCIREQLLGELIAYGRASYVNHWDGGAIETVFVAEK